MTFEFSPGFAEWSPRDRGGEKPPRLERFTQEDKPKPDKNKGNWSKTSSKSGTTTFKPNQEEASKSGQVKQTKAKNKRGSKTNGRTFKSQYDIPKNNKG